MSCVPRRLALIGTSVVAFAIVPDARAQSQGQADQLFQQGRELLEQGRFAEACEKLRRSEELAPAVGTLLNLGYCLEQIDKMRSAMEAYSEAEILARKAGDTKRAAFAKERLAVIEPKQMKLIVRVVPPEAPGLVVTRNGARVPKTDWGQPIPVDAEDFAIEASAPEHASWKGVVTARGDGAVITVYVPPLAPGSPAAADGKPPTPTVAFGTRRLGALAIGGLAIASLGAGVGMALAAKGHYDDSQRHCDASGCDEDGLAEQRSAVRQGNVATVLVAIGLVTAGASAYLWIAGGEEKPAKASASRPRWRLGVQPLGAAFGARF
jgi:tetratricopeptide (TPR) repeat protein